MMVEIEQTEEQKNFNFLIIHKILKYAYFESQIQSYNRSKT